LLASDQTRSKAALRRLGIKPYDLIGVPPLSEIFRELRWTKAQILDSLAYSEEVEVRAFLEKYRSIPQRDLDSLSFEAIAVAASINPKKLLGEVMLAMREHSVNMVKLIAITSHPDVMKKTVEKALTLDGTKDRDTLHTMLGALPSNKGTTFINKFFASGTRMDASEEADAPEAQEMVDDLDFVFPDCSEIQESIHPLRQKLLDTGK